jgi:murein L,D-transpeptidase YafK
MRAARAGHAFLRLMGFVFLVSSISIGTYAEDRLPSNARADRVLVVKSARTLTLLNHGHVLKTYKVALGGDPIGAKTRQGDHKTPEGIYVLDRRNAHSQFYRAIHISYPNVRDRERARTLGASPGGDIMLHGLPNGYRWIGKGHRARDWTDGCIAVTDEEMDEIWRAVPDGTVIDIRP